MSPKLQRASAAAVTATFLAVLASAQGSGAIAQSPVTNPVTGSGAIEAKPAPQFVSQPVVQPIPAESAEQAAPQDAQANADAPISATSLAELVEAQPQPAELSSELRCLAGAIYFEAKSESLPGQLAVGRVVVNRAKSGRFPSSYCGVVYQPSQFSFVRGHSMPAIRTNSQDWREAVAIAEIAHANSWRSPTEGALFFHAARVSPGWHLTRVARVDNHVFYR
jgi:spore germination cell wall hydrolase CwlJ-like protein